MDLVMLTEWFGGCYLFGMSEGILLLAFDKHARIFWDKGRLSKSWIYVTVLSLNWIRIQAILYSKSI